ncbi:MAG: hypothetical protein CMF38_00770 [Legionellaceae bacterium]|nr:hypothetical protein [Legionellaceae bacterium]HAF87497.1 hypothetical protein [Legionellales bacterium]HCA89160.1 hypothetical protein [Legionellales bacterium]|tara:strand:+ start:1076 stop:1486 length:411 start_codon:yes stop_codon:yes gene_type:complete
MKPIYSFLTLSLACSISMPLFAAHHFVHKISLDIKATPEARLYADKICIKTAGLFTGRECGLNAHLTSFSLMENKWQGYFDENDYQVTYGVDESCQIFKNKSLFTSKEVVLHGYLKLGSQYDIPIVYLTSCTISIA